MRNCLAAPLAVAFALALTVSGSACISVPPVHPRALENNELCADHINHNNLTKAEVHCDLGLQFSPQYADLWVNKGLISLRRGNQGEAKEHFIKALRFNQEQAQAYNNLGFIYLKEQSYGRAHDNFQRALKVNPDYREARYNLALCFFYMKEFDKAKKEYRTLVAIAPELADPHHDLCIMAMEEGQYETAIDSCKEAVRLDPSYADAWLNLGLAYGEIGKFAEAAEAETACLEAEPDNAQCRNNLAIHKRKSALVDPTLQEIKDTQTAENSPAALYQLGQTYRSQGLKSEEERAYRRCLKLDGKFAACHFALYEIYSDERKDRDANIACKNFLKFAETDDFPDQVQTCERYLSANN